MISKIAIVIPARYGSSRFPGKPLKKIGSLSMLEHTCNTALKAAKNLPEKTSILVATEDKRILEHAQSIKGVQAVLTSHDCPTGSDRVLEAIENAGLSQVKIIINLQGDAPFTPADFIIKIATSLLNNSEHQVATPIVQLSWDQLDELRENKKTTPFSGTTAIVDKNKSAIWFSKNIIPAIRNEHKHRDSEKLSPVFQHIGLYGFQLESLKKFVKLPESHFEKLEGLEQLRLLENGFKIHTELVSYGNSKPVSGIDTPEDLARTQKDLEDKLIGSLN